MIQLGMNLVAASNRTDQAEIAWIYEIQQEGAMFERFTDSGKRRFHALDTKLSVAMSTMIRNSKKIIAEDALIKMDEVVKQGRMLTGRQFAWMLCDYFKTNHALEQVRNITNLQELAYPGDKNMHRFRTMWHFIVNNF